MGKPRYGKQDSNFLPEFTERLKHYPAISWFPCGHIIGEFDAVVGYNGTTWLVEVKNPDTSHTLTKSQKEFIADWHGSYLVVETLDDLLIAIGAQLPDGTLDVAVMYRR